MALWSDAPSFATLETLATSADIRDRAFAASALALRGGTQDRERVAALYERIRDTARAHHAAARAHILEGTLDRSAFLAELQSAAPAIRDHLVEEILDLAYPPLDEGAVGREVVLSAPSGLSEILFAIEKAKLGPASTFVDLGSGQGKVVLLVALLSGARAYGLELDPRLVARAREAARSLGLDRAQFVEGDIRAAPLPPADVYYMYIPLIRSSDVAQRLQARAAERPILLFAQALDLAQLPWLRAKNAASYWLEMYEAG